MKKDIDIGMKFMGSEAYHVQGPLFFVINLRIEKGFHSLDGIRRTGKEKILHLLHRAGIVGHFRAEYRERRRIASVRVLGSGGLV